MQKKIELEDGKMEKERDWSDLKKDILAEVVARKRAEPAPVQEAAASDKGWKELKAELFAEADVWQEKEVTDATQLPNSETDEESWKLFRPDEPEQLRMAGAAFEFPPLEEEEPEDTDEEPKPSGEELLSIVEFAKQSGESMQSIYRQLNNTLKPYVELVESRTMLQKRALSEVFGMETEEEPISVSDEADGQPIPEQETQTPAEEEPVQETEEGQTPAEQTAATVAPPLDDAVTQLLKEQMEALKEQLQVKDSQIRDLNTRLEESNNALVNAQQTAQAAQTLHAVAVQKQLMEENPAPQEEPTKKRGFFARLFGRKD